MKTINNKLTRWGLLAAICVGMTQVFEPSPANAAGLLIADGGFGGVLEIKEHNVQVTINNGIAVTKVTQVFQNTESRQVEALYTFPVPNGASVANFSMWINGKEMVGEVIEKKRARQIYESYKRKRQDPGLLEQVDYKTFEMRIFPIGPEAEQKVQISYYQELDYDHDWGTYVYPLATSTRAGIDTRTTGKFAISFDVKSAVPIVSLESPSHGQEFVIAKHSEEYMQASLETNGGNLNRDVVLAYHLSRPKTGFDLIASKESQDDGYFCLTLTAGEDLTQLDRGMDYVFVLDVSGSMANDGKLLLSKDSIGAFINELGKEDRFEVMTFNVSPNLAFTQLQPATDENKVAAVDYLRTKSARGGTVLNSAIQTAYKYAEADRPLNVIILSDGLTEQRERQTLLQLIQTRPESARVFCIGVGNGVNRPLLEQLAEDSGGLAAFISRGDNFERQAKAFRRKLTRPVVSNLQIDFNGVQVSDVQPRRLPNLYHGSPIRIYGRYRDKGMAEITLRGSINGVEFKKSAPMDYPRSDSSNPEIDRMWAWHRIDGLLKDADRTGSRSSVIDEVVGLGESFSIVTEYTSFLVLENDTEYRRWKIDRKNTIRLARDRQAQEQLQVSLDQIRNKAIAGLGPIEEEKAEQSPTQVTRTARAPQTPALNQAPAPRRQSSDLNFGGGPVGPLFLGLILLVQRLRRRANA